MSSARRKKRSKAILGATKPELTRPGIAWEGANIRQKADFLAPQEVFEDETILVLNKPAGLVVNRAKTVKGKTAQDWVEGKLKVKSEKLKVRGGDFYQRAGVVHRLDKETSGLLLVAKTPEAFENLQRQFKERQVKKKYLALVHGKVAPQEGIIEAPIIRSPFDRKKFGVFLGGRGAETKYKVLSIKYKVSKGKKIFYSLLEVKPKTGRTHQIRVHLKHIGHPVVGDAQYAGRKTAREDRQWCPRHFLHASFLSFAHPKTGKEVKFATPPPDDLAKTLAEFRQNSSRQDLK